jgi:S-(hydroxymethyl)glutathione dehydrogenase/alcohol dehydrogenase
VLGHEGAGVVEAVGEGVTSVTPRFGAAYTFEATGLVGVMRQAVEAARMGWGLCTVAGVAGKGETLDVVPQLVQRYLDGDIDVDPFISPRIRPDDVNRGFELMEAQDGIRSVIESD